MAKKKARVSVWYSPSAAAKSWGYTPYTPPETYNYWGDYEGFFKSYEATYASAEKRRKFKTAVQERAAETYNPIEVRVNQSATSFFKRQRMTVNINEKDLNKYNKKDIINKIVDMYDKIPYNSDIIDNAIIQYATIKSSEFWKYLKEGKVQSDVQTAIEEYDNWTITYAQLRDNFRPLTPKEKQEIGAMSDNVYKWGWSVGTYVKFSDKSTYSKNLKIIQSRVVLRDTILFEESYRKGKRINRNFVTWNSLKALVWKTVESQKKKKIFFILDCSWSMGGGNNIDDPSHKAISFAAAVVNSWKFDCDHVIYHSSWGWENCAPRIKKWDLFNLSWGSEWFEHVDDNLNREWLQWVDYIVALTDLQICSQAEQGLADYLKKGKRHLIMSFAGAWTLKGMNVRCIKKTSDMINSLVTLCS